MKYALPLTLALAASCKARTDDSAVKLVGGEVALAAEHPEVFFLDSCTSTKVGPRAIITAAHCVLNKETGQLWDDYKDGGTIRYTFARTVDTADLETMRLVRAHVFPSYLAQHVAGRTKEERTGLYFDHPDVAILEVEPSGAFAAAPIATVDFRAVATGDGFVMMGYGSEGDDAAAQAQAPRLKTATVEATDGEAAKEAVKLLKNGNRVKPTVHFAHISDVVNLGGGDSGGPVFRVTDDGGGLVGINSYGLCPTTNKDCQKTNNSFFTRLDKGAAHGAGEWLEATLARLRPAAAASDR